MKPLTRTLFAVLFICSAVAEFPLARASHDCSSSSELVNFRFILWIGQPVREEHAIEMNVPVNTTLFQAMVMAAQIDVHFKFEYREYSFGNYITSINNVTEDVASQLAWMLYVLPSSDVLNGIVDPAQLNTFLATKGVSSLVIEDGDNILFWYRKYNLH